MKSTDRKGGGDDDDDDDGVVDHKDASTTVSQDARDNLHKRSSHIDNNNNSRDNNDDKVAVVAKKVQQLDITKQPPSSSSFVRMGKRGVTRVGVGKANPVRDVMVFGVIVAILLVVFSGVDPFSSFSSSPKQQEQQQVVVVDDTKEEEEDEEEIPIATTSSLSFTSLTQQLNQVVENLAESLLKERFPNAPRIEPCSTFLGPGSIPETGLSFFAGQDYQAGDTVVMAVQQQQQSPPLVPLVPLYLPNGNAMWIPTFAFLLKHHPTLSNVQVEGQLYLLDHDINDNDKQSQQQQQPRFQPLRATRSIAAGEELFVSFQSHPHSFILQQHKLHRLSSQPSPAWQWWWWQWWLDSIPTQDDYVTAHEIVKDAQQTMRALHWSVVRQSPAAAKLLGSDPTFLYSSLHRTLQRFNPRVAALFQQGQRFSSSSSSSSSSSQRTFTAKIKAGKNKISNPFLTPLVNRTLQSLSMQATCQDDLVIQLLHQHHDQEEDEEKETDTTKTPTTNTVVTTTKSFSKGDILTRIPILVFRSQQDLLPPPSPLTSRQESTTKDDDKGDKEEPPQQQQQQQHQQVCTPAAVAAADTCTTTTTDKDGSQHLAFLQTCFAVVNNKQQQTHHDESKEKIESRDPLLLCPLTVAPPLIHHHHQDHDHDDHVNVEYRWDKDAGPKTTSSLSSLWNEALLGNDSGNGRPSGSGSSSASPHSTQWVLMVRAVRNIQAGEKLYASSAGFQKLIFPDDGDWQLQLQSSQSRR